MNPEIEVTVKGGPQKRPRDSQRSKVYRAEAEAMTETRVELEWAEVEALVARVYSSAYILGKYPRAGRGKVRAGGPPTVTKARGGGSYSPGRHEIRLGKWGRCEWVVLHEIAHALAYRSDRAWHGWEFTSTMLDLVETFMGEEDAARLKAAYRKHKARIAAPRKVALSAEERARRAARLAEVRARMAAGETARAEGEGLTVLNALFRDVFG